MSVQFRRRRGVLEWRDTRPVQDAQTLQIVETNNAVARALIWDASFLNLEQIAERVVRG